MLTQFGEQDYIDLITTTQEGSEMNTQSDDFDYDDRHESHPSDYGYGGFEDWDDFNRQADAMEAKCIDNDYDE